MTSKRAPKQRLQQPKVRYVRDSSIHPPPLCSGITDPKKRPFDKAKLPTSQDWKHRDWYPCYFVTKDGLYQTLMDESEQFVVCSTRKTKRGYRVVLGPVRDLEDLGIPPQLIDEADILGVDYMIRWFSAHWTQDFVRVRNLISATKEKKQDDTER